MKCELVLTRPFSNLIRRICIEATRDSLSLEFFEGSLSHKQNYDGQHLDGAHYAVLQVALMLREAASPDVWRQLSQTTVAEWASLVEGLEDFRVTAECPWKASDRVRIRVQHDGPRSLWIAGEAHYDALKQFTVELFQVLDEIQIESDESD